MTNTARISGLLFDDNNVNGIYEPAEDKVTFIRPGEYRQPAIDSNINPDSGMSNIINLNPGATNLSVDAGLIQL